MKRRTVYKESPSSKAAFKEKYGVEPKGLGAEAGPAFSKNTISTILKRRSRKGRISFRKGTQLKSASRRHLGSFVKTERVKALKRNKDKPLFKKEKAPKDSEPQTSRPVKEKPGPAEPKPKKKKIFRLFSRSARKLQKVPENEPMRSIREIQSGPARKRDDVEKNEETSAISNITESGSQKGTPQPAGAGNDKCDGVENQPTEESLSAAVGDDGAGAENVPASPDDKEKPVEAENVPASLDDKEKPVEAEDVPASPDDKEKPVEAESVPASLGDEEKTVEAETTNTGPGSAGDASPVADTGNPGEGDPIKEVLKTQPNTHKESTTSPTEEDLEESPGGSSDSGDKENTGVGMEAGEMKAGEMEAGEIDAGEMKAGEIDAGEMKAEDIDAVEMKAEEIDGGAAEEGSADDGDDGGGVEKTDPGRLNLERWESEDNREKNRPTMQLQHQESASDEDLINPKMKLKYDQEAEEDLQLEEKTMQLKELEKPESFKGEKPQLDHLDPIDPLVQAFNKQKSLSRKKSGKAKGMNVLGQWVNMNGKWLRIAMVMEEQGQL
ncbi:hypothetical protein BSKO_08337 [Bryopsis sp. KO-2023]|nr:hypothetical protein BSKO_08337 [Bryopsis sp. KO-2023]